MTDFDLILEKEVLLEFKNKQKLKTVCHSFRKVQIDMNNVKIKIRMGSISMLPKKKIG